MQMQSEERRDAKQIIIVLYLQTLQNTNVVREKEGRQSPPRVSQSAKQLERDQVCVLFSIFLHVCP